MTTISAAKSLQAGHLVALVLKPEVAPIRCYVGEVQDVDQHGVRVTLIDWLIGMFCGDDLWVPWDSILSALVATPEHDKKLWIESAKRWQNWAQGKEDER